MEVVNTTSTTDPMYYYNYLNNFMLNPVVFTIIALVIIMYFGLSFTISNKTGGGLGDSSNSSESSGSSKIVGIIIVIVLIFLIIVNAFQYFFSISVTAYIQNFLTPQATLDIVVDQGTYQPSTIPEIKFRKQVFNIPGNVYNYENAGALCQAYGAELATYEQIEKAYNNGGEWCNYGWSQGQMALFPTQQNTFNELQQIEGHEQDCGRPGINGGYIANPEVKFGVNCYGNKPKINAEEQDLMQTIPKYPLTNKELIFDKRVDYWKNHVDEILVSPFNQSAWSAM